MSEFTQTDGQTRFKLGKVSASVLIKRFSQGNFSHPVYKALIDSSRTWLAPAPKGTFAAATHWVDSKPQGHAFVKISCSFSTIKLEAFTCASPLRVMFSMLIAGCICNQSSSHCQRILDYKLVFLQPSLKTPGCFCILPISSSEKPVYFAIISMDKRSFIIASAIS
jgi:hypothetical protein